jgi:dGTPase
VTRVVTIIWQTGPRGRHRADNDEVAPAHRIRRDSIVRFFQTPVERLQDKAQVFPLERRDAVRTRLTHSLEVSSVARGS